MQPIYCALRGLEPVDCPGEAGLRAADVENSGLTQCIHGALMESERKRKRLSRQVMERQS